jgi:hypothetical protein
MFKRLATLLCFVALPALAADWRPYANARFGYVIDLPADFSVTGQADNGDGMTLQSKDKAAELRVFGAAITEDDFAAEIKSRIGMDTGDGWAISYNKSSKKWASYSGARKDRILYVRAIALCNQAAGYFTLEYPKAGVKDYDPVVSRLVKTLMAPPNCG